MIDPTTLIDSPVFFLACSALLNLFLIYLRLNPPENGQTEAINVSRPMLSLKASSLSHHIPVITSKASPTQRVNDRTRLLHESSGLLLKSPIQSQLKLPCDSIDSPALNSCQSKFSRARQWQNTTHKIEPIDAVKTDQRIVEPKQSEKFKPSITLENVQKRVTPPQVTSVVDKPFFVESFRTNATNAGTFQPTNTLSLPREINFDRNPISLPSVSMSGDMSMFSHLRISRYGYDIFVWSFGPPPPSSSFNIIAPSFINRSLSTPSAFRRNSTLRFSELFTALYGAFRQTYHESDEHHQNNPDSTQIEWNDVE